MAENGNATNLFLDPFFYVADKLPAALDRIHRIKQNFSWVDGSLR